MSPYLGTEQITTLHSLFICKKRAVGEEGYRNKSSTPCGANVLNEVNINKTPSYFLVMLHNNTVKMLSELKYAFKL